MPDQDFYQKLFSRNLNRFMDLRGKTQADIVRDLKINKSAISTWCNGTRLPRMDKVDLLAKYLGVQRADLLDEEGEHTEQGYYLDPETARVAQEILDDPHLHALFDAAMDAKPEDLKMAAEMLRRFKGTNPEG